ncbi:MAG: DUF58 domain-containing protein [Gammaproteobacteria bacterium]|nr:DUF58 domain-containing protein [Gammaproteobacteria bacterium]MYD80179.1 DUF58 domain-containing protein [Gammaproteobacteria bacterium]
MKPTKLLVVAILLVAAASIFREYHSIVVVLMVVGMLVVLLDALTLQKRGNLVVERRVPNTLAFGQSTKVRLYIQHDLNQRLRVAINDRCPLELSPNGLPLTSEIELESTHLVEYTINPTLRGDFKFTFVDLAVDSMFGFWQRIVHVECNDEVRVYPDFSQITKYLQLLLVHQTNQMGIKKQVRRGEGLEFLQLREYRQADPLNRIDWKATSKRRNLISREFQEERSQQLLFLVDTGRRMHSHDGEVSLFDRTLDAMTLLSYIALSQGDRVSILCFGQENRWIPSQTGLSAVGSLLRHTYDLQTGTVASDYVAAAEELLVRQRKRALVVLITSLRDDDKDLPSALRLLAVRHSVLLASLRENTPNETLKTRVQNIDQALAVLGAAKYLEERTKALNDCRRACHLVVDSLPSELYARLVNAYWYMKRAGIT